MNHNFIIYQIPPEAPEELENIFSVMDRSVVDPPLNWQAPPKIETAIDTFVGYLLLDAWIGNSDRHHENWGFINLDGKSYLAPTYDHASCLGRNELDGKRKKRLKTNDKTYSVEVYANRCKSCIYVPSGDRKLLRTFDAFCTAAKLFPQAASVWLDRLNQIEAKDTLELFNLIPSSYISPTAIEFAQEILKVNQDKLIRFRQEFL